MLEANKLELSWRQKSRRVHVYKTKELSPPDDDVAYALNVLPPPPANVGEDPRDHRKPEPDTDKYFDNLAEEDEPDQNASIFDFGRDL